MTGEDERGAPGAEGDEFDRRQYDDYAVLDDARPAGEMQQWCCAGCGRTVLPGHESVVYLVEPAVSDNVETAKFALFVHAACRLGMIAAGTFGEWRKRIDGSPPEEGQFAPDEAVGAVAAVVGAATDPWMFNGFENLP